MGDLVEVVVETPRSSRNVYEVDDGGRVRFDRRLPGSFAYPADYGYVVGTTGSDGEPLDALVLLGRPPIRMCGLGLAWLVCSGS